MVSSIDSFKQITNSLYDLKRVSSLPQKIRKQLQYILPKNIELITKYAFQREESLPSGSAHFKILKIISDYSSEEPLIFQAVATNDLEMMERLLQDGIDIEVENLDGRTPLTMAVRESQHRMVKVLLDAGADVNAKDLNGRTPVFDAIKNKDEKTFDLITSHLEFKPDGFDESYCESPLSLAIVTGNVNMVRTLIEKGADINKMVGRCSVFAIALKQENPDILRLFLKHPQLNFIGRVSDMEQYARFEKILTEVDKQHGSKTKISPCNTTTTIEESVSFATRDSFSSSQSSKIPTLLELFSRKSVFAEVGRLPPIETELDQKNSSRISCVIS